MKLCIAKQLVLRPNRVSKRARRTVAASAQYTLTANKELAISTGEVLASCGQTQDQAKLNNIRVLNGFNTVYTSPAEMRMPERVALV